MITLYDGKPVPKVIDFGVAKATEQRLTERTLFTQYGAMVGTLEYMSPEQAEMSALGVDTRTDIYSLGVLLYELLTGSTPLTHQRLKEAAYAEILRLIKEEEPPKPSTRLSESGEALASISAQRHTEPAKLAKLMRGELDWIVMKTLEKDRNRRYETASAFAADVQRYLADEPVAACPPSAWYRFRKFTRRHKSGLRIAAAAVLVLLLAVGGVSWALWDQATRQVETERTVNAALTTMEGLRDQAGKMPRRTSEEADAIVVVWQQAEAALAPALVALKTGTPNDLLRQQVLDAQQESEQERVQAQRKAKLLRDLDEARLSRSNWIESGFDHAGAAAQYASAFKAYDLEVKPGRTEELARRIRAEEAGIRDALIVALYDRSTNALHAKTELLAKELRELAGAVDDDAWRRKYRAAATAGDGMALRALSREARQLSLPPSSLVLLAWSLRDQGERAEMLALLRWARVRYPGDFWVNYVLGNFLTPSEGGFGLELEEAIGCYTAALALRPKATAAYRRLGMALLDKNQADARDAAIYAFKQALIVDPKSAVAQTDVGIALAANKQLDEAIAALKKAIELNPKYADAHSSLGLALGDNGLKDEAIAECREGIRLQPDFSHAHIRLGHVLGAKGLKDEAIAEFREGTRLQPGSSYAHSSLGYALGAKGSKDEAIAEFREAVRLQPKNSGLRRGLGNALLAKGLLDEAIAEYQKAIDLKPDDAHAHFILAMAFGPEHKGLLDKSMAEYREALRLDPEFAKARVNLGYLLVAKGLPDEGIAEFQKVLRVKRFFAEAYKAHSGLGYALMAKGLLERASAEYREAIRLKPDDDKAHNGLGAVLAKQGQLDEAITEYQKALQWNPNSARAQNNIGDALAKKGRRDEAITAYQKAIRIDPKIPEIHFNLGKTLGDLGRFDEAIDAYQQAIQRRPGYAEAYFNLGEALRHKGRLDDAIAAYTEAIRLKPADAKAHVNRGNLLGRKGRPDEAIAAYEQAIRLNPGLAEAHSNLGDELRLKRRLDQAIAECEMAVRLAPDRALYRKTLAAALRAKGRVDEAIAEYKKAIELDPKDAMAHYKLGNVLEDKKQSDDAITEFKKAIEIDPKLASVHNHLGYALATKNKLDEAIAAYKKAIELVPTNAPYHYNLGIALAANNQLDEAVAAYKKAIDLQPDYAEAHCNLANTLRLQGQLSASLDFYKRGHALGSKHWRYPSAQWVTDAERLVRLEAKLPDVVAGKTTPTDKGELLGLLEVCRLKRRYVAAGRLYGDAFSADPKLADDLKAGHRYDAACYAALAAAGQGTDAGKLDDQEQSRLRQQALAWLRADLEQWSKRLEGGKPEDRQVVRAKLERWQRNTDLAGVRDADALKKLSAQEQEAWRKLWADVAELLKKAGNAK
jgi:tetratricopeptide (TPR) repeat protein